MGRGLQDLTWTGEESVLREDEVAMRVKMGDESPAVVLDLEVVAAVEGRLDD